MLSQWLMGRGWGGAWGAEGGRQTFTVYLFLLFDLTYCGYVLPGQGRPNLRLCSEQG